MLDPIQAAQVKKVAEQYSACNFCDMKFKSRNDVTGTSTYTITFIKDGEPFDCDVEFKDGKKGDKGDKGENGEGGGTDTKAIHKYANLTLDFKTMFDKSGMYRCFNMQDNIPKGYTNGDNDFYVEVYVTDENFIILQALDVRSGRKFKLIKSGGVWNDWDEDISAPEDITRVISDITVPRSYANICTVNNKTNEEIKVKAFRVENGQQLENSVIEANYKADFTIFGSFYLEFFTPNGLVRTRDLAIKTSEIIVDYIDADTINIFEDDIGYIIKTADAKEVEKLGCNMPINSMQANKIVEANKIVKSTNVKVTDALIPILEVRDSIINLENCNGMDIQVAWGNDSYVTIADGESVEYVYDGSNNFHFTVKTDFRETISIPAEPNTKFYYTVYGGYGYVYFEHADLLSRQLYRLSDAILLDNHLRVFLDNEAAKNDGLRDGEIYRKATGELMVVF